MNSESRSKTRALVTFGQPFRPGDVAADETVEAITFDGQHLPTQVDWKAANGDGSRRHGIVTVTLPDMQSGQRLPIGLYRKAVADKGGPSDAQGKDSPPALDASVELDIDGKRYTASFNDLVVDGVERTWLEGGLATEWHVAGPVVDDQGQPHDRISVRFYLRDYPHADRQRLAVVVENTATFKPDPRNIQYDARIRIAGREIYSKKALKHIDHARWIKVYWIGGDPDIYVRHDLAYLKATGAIPNYDPGLDVPQSAVRKLYREYRRSKRGPMAISIVEPAMPNTGGRPDIGPLPRWTVLRLLTMDPRMIQVDRDVNALAGSWPIHLRDSRTQRPVSLEDRPDLSIHPNLAGKRDNPLPEAGKNEGSHRLQPDLSHEPSFGFVPYLLSGNYYYLEEMQFWAAWNPLRTSPSYRGREKGLFKWTQVRGQAWGLRTLGQTAYATPDDDPMKGYWQRQLKANLSWYNEHYPNDPDANELGVLTNNVIYKDESGKRRGISPWQDDFFTWTMGYLVDLGFEQARPMLEFKARFPIGRMIAPGFCPVFGAAYKLFIRENEGSPFYRTFERVYRESVMTEALDLECGSSRMAAVIGDSYQAGDMTGYPHSAQGFPANMQPGLAAAVDSGIEGGHEAWAVFMNRPTKPNYSIYPNWAIVPRSEPADPANQ